MPVYSLDFIAQAISTTCNQKGHVEAVSVDSRLTKPGDLFFALPGKNVDGYSFLKEAVNKGASAAVIAQSAPIPRDLSVPVLRVDNPLKALQTLAKVIISQRPSKIIGITGSYGKTTTKEFVTALLKTKFKTACSPGNSNSQIGLPLTILNHTNGDEEYLVLEMAMTHAGNIAELVQIAPPDLALITALGLVHIANFESLQQIGMAKAEIFSHPKTKLGILHRDLEYFDEIARIGNFPKQSFSLKNPEADFFLTSTSHGMQVREGGREYPLATWQIPGEHNKHNFLAAAALARNAGMEWEEIHAAQKLLKLPEKRFELVTKQGVVFLNDSYNASEDTMKAALASLPNPAPGSRRIAVFGEMVDLGAYSEHCHAEVGKAALSVVDYAICLGKGCAPIVDVWKKAQKPVIWAETRHEVVQTLSGLIQPGDVVLLKGSNMNCLWLVLEELA